MEEGRPSVTAMLTAMLRAAHLLWDDPPRIFEDSFALALSGCANEVELRERVGAFLAELAAKADLKVAVSIFDSFRFSVVLRSRYVEDELAQAIARGVAQYVILGAGLDSFAFRRQDLANALRIFEVDHPATQTWKRARLQELSVATPPNLVFVPMNFEQQSLIESLRNCGYRTDTAGCFSWLGVTWYLTHDAIFESLRAVASMATGTEIIFDHLPPAERPDDEGRQARELLHSWAAARDEPFVTFFEPTNLAEQVRKLGFAEVSDVGADEINARYLANRTDGLRLCGSSGLMRARV